MKRIIFYLATTLTVFLLGLFMTEETFSPQYKGPLHYQAFQPNEKVFYTGDEKKIEGNYAEGHARYLSLIRANPFTGKVSAGAVKKAVKQANENPVYKKQNNDFSWQSKGPDNIGGRTRAIVTSNQEDNVVFAGGVSGGLWRSDNGGTSWQPVPYEGANRYKSLSIVCMEQASNGGIYFGTGEQGFAAGSYKTGRSGKTGHIGMGMWKSTDDGETWKHLKNTIPNSPFTSSTDGWNNVHELTIHPEKPEMVLAATDKGIKISKDGGQSWSKSSVGDNGLYSNNVFLEVIFSPNGSTVYAASKEKVFKSTDKGQNFTMLNDSDQDALPKSGLGRIEIAIAPSDPDFVYLSMVSGSFDTRDQLRGIYLSRDNGDTWETLAKGSGLFYPFSRGGNFAQGTYNNAMEVDPTQKDRLFLGGVQFWTWNGGGDFDAKGQWNQAASNQQFDKNDRYMHVDHHEITFDMDVNPPVMYVGNDGGVFKTKGNFTQENLPRYKEVNTGYNTTQFYAFDAAKSGDIMGGTQDNNTLKLQKNGYTGKSFEPVIGGDGFYCEIADINNDIFIGESINANINRSRDAGESIDQISFEKIDNLGSKTLFNNPFKLYENLNDSLSKDSVTYSATNEVVLEAGEVIDTVKDENLPLYNSDDEHFKSLGDQSFEAKKAIAKLPGEKVKVLSRNSVKFPYKLTKALAPLDVIKVQDPVRTFFTLPLRNEIWLTDQMLNFSVNPSWFKLADVSLQTPMVLDYTPDGNTLYVGGWDRNLSRLYRIEGLRTAHFDEGEFDQSELDVQLIETFENVVTGISIDPNDEDRLLVTCGNYGTKKHVFYSQNAMQAANAVNFEALDNLGPEAANLPTMPVYDGLFRQDSAKQVFVGTEMGVWFLNLDKRNQGWIEVNEGMPRVATHMVRQVKPTEWATGPRIYAATHGRGIFYTSSTNPSAGTDDWQRGSNSNFDPSLKVYPNPAGSYANVQYDVSKGFDGYLQVIDLKGQVVKQNPIPGNGRKETEPIPVSDLKPGTYIVRIQGNQFDKQTKLTITH